MSVTSNPFIQESRFGRSAWLEEIAGEHRQEMTLPGTVIASAVLIGVCAVSAAASWGLTTQWGAPGMALLLGAVLVGFISGMLVHVFPRQAGWLGWIYAASEGVFLGAISQAYQLRVVTIAGSAIAGNALIAQAVVLTFGVFAAMLLAYATGMLRPGAIFLRILAVGTIALVLVSVASLVLWLVGFPSLGHALYGSGPIGILFSLFCVGLSSSFLLMDFDVIRQGVEARSPKHMEWVAAVGLLATLVWVYLEILRLLAKLSSRRN